MAGLLQHAVRKLGSVSHLLRHQTFCPTSAVLHTLLSEPETFRIRNSRPGLSEMLRERQIHTSVTRKGLMEDHETKSLTVWSSIKEVRTSPFPALTLGLSGLSPFVGIPAYMMLQQVYSADLAFVQVAYGATILAFLGGIRWGFTIPEENPIRPDWLNLGYSVLPPLVAWAGLLLPHPLSLFSVLGGLTLAGYFDMAMYGYPPWFKGLRFILSFVAVLSLWTTFMCGFLLKDKRDIQHVEGK